jgi:hypothetical protein
MTGHSVQKPKVRFLTCLWGREHRSRWLALSLPSLLAPGNLPALADSTDLEVVILTDRKSAAPIRAHPAFRRLEKTCQTQFLEIDDLIVGTTYGVTLTLAYARGVMSAGEEQTNTTFVFMNSDFIVADGSLASLADRIRSGHRCIVAPSLRVSAERLLPRLRKTVNEHRLTLKPRTLVELALANLHLTALGKTFGQDEFHCVSFNQCYWRVGRSALLGRYHLLFMLCIRPERPLGPVNSYCDYGLIPELVPSSPMVALTDSDEFFMLELGPELQEENLLRFGPARFGHMTESLRRWTTKEHRQSAEFNFVFHSGPLPKELDRASKNAATFIAGLHASMGDRPVSHVDHHYWIRGMQHWLRAKATGAVVQLPAELAGGLLEKWLAKYVVLIGWMQGTPPDVPMRAYDWNDYRLVRRWLTSLGETPEKSVLFVCPEDSRLRGWLAADPRVKTHIFSDDRIATQESSTRYRYILLHAHADFLRKPDRMFEALLGRLAAGGEIAIFIGGKRRRPDRENLNPRLMNFVRRFMWRHTNELSWKLFSVNGYAQRLCGAILFKITDMGLDDFIKTRLRWAPIAIVAAPILIAVVAVLNASFVDRLALRLSQYRSAALLCCRRINEPVEGDSDEERAAA